MDDHDLISIATFEYESQASVLRVALNAAGIPSQTSGDVAGFLGFTTAAGLSGVQVYVRRAELEEAMKVIHELKEIRVDEVPAWECKCGESVDAGFEICWSCGEDWPDQSDRIE